VAEREVAFAGAAVVVLTTLAVAPNLVVGEENVCHGQGFGGQRDGVAVFLVSVYKAWTMIERAVVASFTSK
jgi:hypothetical protein